MHARLGRGVVGWPKAPLEPLTEEILMIRPQPRVLMPSVKGLVIWKTESVGAQRRPHSAFSMRLKVRSRVMPALLTRMSTVPKRARISLAQRWQSS